MVVQIKMFGFLQLSLRRIVGYQKIIMLNPTFGMRPILLKQINSKILIAALDRFFFFNS